MKTDTDRAARAAEELLNELRALAAEAEKAVANSAEQHAEQTLETLRARFEACTQRFTDLYRGTKEKVAAGARRTDEAIRKHPYQSLAVAASIGLLAGLLLARRKD